MPIQSPIASFHAYTLLVFLATSSPAQETPSAAPAIVAGFKCDAAQNAVEKMICGDAELADRDRRMTILFSELRRESDQGKKDGILRTQRDWLQTRNACGDSSCVSAAYDGRIGDILSAMPSIGSTSPISKKAIDQLLHVFAGMTPDDVQNFTTSENRAALSEASCTYFERSPKAAAELFRPYFGSSRDGYQPLCGTIDIFDSVPATKDFVQALEAAAAPGHCFGTIMYGEFRAQYLTRIEAVVDASPDFAAYEHRVEHRYDKLSYQPDLEHWSQQGLWEKRIYAEVRRTQPLARAGLRDFYMSHFHLDEHGATRVADYYIDQMMDAYIRDHSGFSSTLAYPSLCFEKRDLDQYLTDGKLPARECPYHEFADMSDAHVLRRLLGLAIVNDYPLETIQRLIKAGAAMDAARNKKYDYEASADSPLMMAVERADVVDALLKAGANANATNGFGKTPLMYAAAARNLSAVQALLRAGADANAATAPLDAFCSDLKAGSRTVLMYAAWHGNAEILQALLQAHANPATKDSNGETALDYVARNMELDEPQRDRLRTVLHSLPAAP